MGMKGARVPPWSTPVEILQNSVSPSGVMTTSSVVEWLNRFHDRFGYPVEWEDVANGLSAY